MTDRLQTPVRAALADIMDDAPPLGSRPSPTLMPPRRRPQLRMALSAAAALVVVLGAGGVWWLRHDGTPPAAPTHDSSDTTGRVPAGYSYLPKTIPDGYRLGPHRVAEATPSDIQRRVFGAASETYVNTDTIYVETMPRGYGRSCDDPTDIEVNGEAAQFCNDAFGDRFLRWEHDEVDIRLSPGTGIDDDELNDFARRLQLVPRTAPVPTLTKVPAPTPMPDGWELLYDSDSLTEAQAVISSYTLLRETQGAQPDSVTVTITQHAPPGAAWWALFRTEQSNEVDINGHTGYRTSDRTVSWMPDTSTLVTVETIRPTTIDPLEFARSLTPADPTHIETFLATSIETTSPDTTTASTNPPGKD
jgi:hypothetical protein